MWRGTDQGWLKYFCAHLVQPPVEFGWLVTLPLGGILAEEEDQPAVVHVEGITVTAHVCRRRTELAFHLPAHM